MKSYMYLSKILCYDNALQKKNTNFEGLHSYSRKFKKEPVVNVYT